jgi:hypothetical protein
MGPDEKGFESTLQRLRDVRHSLLRLHKTLLQWEREEYERAHGRIETSYEFLRLVMHDPWFGWLHHLSELVVQIDEMLAAEEPTLESATNAGMDQARLLLTPSKTGGQFQRKYFDALQRSPDVVLGHAEAIKLLGSDKPANLPADQRSDE